MSSDEMKSADAGSFGTQGFKTHARGSSHELRLLTSLSNEKLFAEHLNGGNRSKFLQRVRWTCSLVFNLLLEIKKSAVATIITVATTPTTMNRSSTEAVEVDDVDEPRKA